MPHLLAQFLPRKDARLVLCRARHVGVIETARFQRRTVVGEHDVDGHAEEVQNGDADQPRDLGLGHEIAVGAVQRGNKDDEEPDDLEHGIDDVLVRREGGNEKDNPSAQMIKTVHAQKKERHKGPHDGKRREGKTAHQLFQRSVFHWIPPVLR